MSNNAPIVDVAAVHVRCTVQGKEVETSLWFKCLNPPVTAAKLGVIANRVATSWQINFASQLASGTLIRSVLAEDRSPGSSAFALVPLNIIRGLQGQSASTNIALRLLNLKTLVRAPHDNSNFIYAIPVNKVVGNMVDEGYANGVLALWATNNMSHRPFGWAHAGVSLYTNGAPRALGVSWEIQSYAVGSYRVASQRRRLLGRPS